MFDLFDAPFKETPVAKDTSDAAAKAARKSLQAVLDDHKAAPFDPDAKKPAKKKKRAQQKRAAKAV
jgi:hypothetical protein